MEDDVAPMPGALDGEGALITDQKSIDRLTRDGYGEEEDGYRLKSFEVLYLMGTDKLEIKHGKKSIGFDKFLEICQKNDPDTLSKYLIYRDLRTRGYVAKDGFGFSMDFRVYDRGHFGEKGAKFLIFGMNEGRKESARSFQRKIDHITKMGKEPVIAVIERRGEIIYYKINRMDFSHNKFADGDSAP